VSPATANAPGPVRFAMAVRPGDGLGFRLAGAEVREVAAGEEAAVLRALLGDPSLGVVAAEEGLLALAPPGLLERARRRGLPVLLPFSLPRSWGEPGRGEAWVAALVRRAVGYGVRLGAAPGGPGGGR
jgi:V/A-type H+-transporting ATPase subunit F